MSFHVFFSMSTGLNTTLFVPNGTKAELRTHIAEVEAILKLKTTKYKDNPKHWDHGDFNDLDDELLCNTIEQHNRWVIATYHQFAQWSKNPVKSGETITPQYAKRFWHGLELLTVPIGRWTGSYYVSRMEVMYEVLRGREMEGENLNAKALTPKQAAAVINSFSQYLDTHDRRLDVPKGYDHLASSYDGGYRWCDKCGAIHPDDLCKHLQKEDDDMDKEREDKANA